MREAYMESRGEVPCLGSGDEIPNVTRARSAKKYKNLSGAEGRKPQGVLARLCRLPMPQATIEIPVQFIRMLSYFREILSEYIRIVIVAYRLLSDSCLWALRAWVRWAAAQTCLRDFIPQTPFIASRRI